MLGGNPPDSFQVHAGMELTDTYVIPGKMEPITWLYKEMGILDKFPKGLIDIVSYKGEIYSVPVNVHRGNVVFYNMKIAKQIGMTKAPTTWGEFLTLLSKAQQKGYIGLALGDQPKWEALHAFESIMLGTLGPDKYNKLWKGEASFSDQAVKTALQYFKDALKYVNSNHASLTWQDAVRLVYDGKAFCNIMGDWAEGYLKTLGWKPGVDFGWFAVPGTQNSFMLISDTFGLPKGAPNRDNAILWLKFLASVEAQDIFNPIKGSIPARIDADKSKYDDYLKWSMNDFSTKAICPSIIHGSATPEAFATALMDAIAMFVTQQNVDATFKQIQNIAKQFGYK